MSLLDASTHDQSLPTPKEVNVLFRKKQDRRAQRERQRRQREIEAQARRQRARQEADWWEIIRRMR